MSDKICPFCNLDTGGFHELGCPAFSSSTNVVYATEQPVPPIMYSKEYVDKLQADLTKAEDDLLCCNDICVKKTRKLQTDLEAVKESHIATLKRERSVYDQNTRTYAKLKEVQADLKAAEEKLAKARKTSLGCLKQTAQYDTENKRLREALENCHNTLILCMLIDKSGQAKASVEIAEQALGLK